MRPPPLPILVGLACTLIGVAVPAAADHDCSDGSKSDTDGDAIPCSLDNCALTHNASQANTDGDSNGDICDSCKFVANDQPPLYQATSAHCDADTDGYGNACDCDFNQDGACNALDVATITLNFNKAAVLGVSDVADSNCDGIVNALDVSNLTLHFNKLMGVAPKTSGLACALATLARPGGCNVAFGE